MSTRSEKSVRVRLKSHQDGGTVCFFCDFNGFFDDALVSFMVTVKVADGHDGILIFCGNVSPRMKKSHL